MNINKDASVCRTRRQMLIRTASVVFSTGSLAFLPKSVWASGAPQAASEGWSGQAVKAAEKILEACCRHPFTQGLADGTLPKKAFLFYVIQNVHYLTGYAASLHALAGRVATMSNLPLEERKRIAKRLHGWAKDTDAVRESLDSVYAAHAAGKRLTDDPLFKTIEPATLLYINYEALCAKTSHPAVGMAALLPCFWVYDGLGQAFVKAQKKSRLNKNPFADWIAGYGSPEYSAEVRQALGIADALAAETDETVKAEMTSAFLTACRMELHLMEAAWRGLTWEPVARPH